ncbi:MAG: hypothetical protein IT385_24260 [Deltaproteobacteria bacterium]|nr:hypothetical protein [Deltaproteobacteria bacterium]
MIRTPSILAHLVPPLALGLVAACASAPESPPRPPGPLQASLERVCVPGGALASRGPAEIAYRIATPGGRFLGPLDERECFFPGADEAGWARVQALPGEHDVPRAIAYGLLADAGVGGASFELGPAHTITRATLGGPVGLTWTWDEAGRALARFDFAWADARATVGGRLGGTTRVHLGRDVPGDAKRVWESTVFSSDGPGPLQEAHAADGPLAFPTPHAHALSGIHPICPLSDREIWEDFDGRVPRVQRCLRGGRDWLRVERDVLGRPTSIVEIPESAGGPRTVRTIHLAWHGQSHVPASLSVARDDVPDGLEARFDARGVPELTRHHRLGLVEGLEITWADGRARSARLWAEGEPGPMRRIVPRSGPAGREQPRLSVDLQIPTPAAGPGTASLD